MSRTSPLAVVGNVNVDLILGPVDPWPKPGSEVMVAHDERRVGGAAGNSALAWSSLGVDFQIAANTGNDQFGSWLREAFLPRSASWPVADCGTTLSVGITHPNGERTFLTTHGHLASLTLPEIRACLNWHDLAGGFLLLCGCFVTDALASDYGAVFDMARARGIRIALDTGWPPEGWTSQTLDRARYWVSRSTCLLLNEAETTALAECPAPEAAASVLRSMMPPDAIVVVKCGAAGAFAQDCDGQIVWARAPEVEVVDTIGAGDVFNAAFLAALAEDRPLKYCLEHGVATASAAISSHPRRYVPPATEKDT